MNWIDFFLLVIAAYFAYAVVVTLMVFIDYKTSQGDSKPLRKEVKERFYPLLIKLGYKKGKATSIDVTFRRFLQDRVHLVQISWDKYYNPSFSVSFGECPNQIVSTASGNVHPEFLEIYCSKAFGHLMQKNRNPFFTPFCFSLQKPLIEMIISRSIRYEPNVVVDELIKHYPQVELWFETKVVGPNIQVEWRPSVK